jgi:hypothetical protein
MDYYSILGLRAGATDDEIKKAYRRLARKYHPDVNREQDAEERFIEITEAYQYLLEKPSVRRPSGEPVYEPPDKEELRRQRAREFARMRYEAFKREVEAFRKKWYYTPLKIIRYTVVYVLYAASIPLLLATVLGYFWFEGVAGLFIGLLLGYIGAQLFQVGRAIHKGTKEYFAEWEK